MMELFWSQVPDPRSAFPEFQKQLPSVAEAKELAAILDQFDAAGSWAHTRVSAPDPADARAEGIRLLVIELVSATCADDTWRIDELKFRRVADALWTLLSSQRAVIEVLVPVAGISVGELIDLEDGVALRPLTHADRVELMNEANNDDLSEILARTAAAVEVVGSVPIGGSQNDLPVRPNDVVRALRLWLPHPIRALMFRTSDPLSSSRGSSRPSAISFWSGPQPIPDSQGFVAFWRQCSGALAKPSKELDLALRRFDMVFEQERSTDRILDYAIILEALLLAEKEELVYRLRLRVAHLLGTTFEERSAISELVKQAYRVRSIIAHGKEPKLKDRAVEREMDGLIREVLRRYCVLVADAQRRGTVVGAFAAVIKSLEDSCLGKPRAVPPEN
jgi:hypothetical protein